MLLLSTDRYNWVEGAAKAEKPVAVQQASPPAQVQTR
jgi:hypothetical protein